MLLANIVAAWLAPAPVAAAPGARVRPPAYRGIDRSRGDQTRLAEPQIEVRSAERKGEIDRATAGEFYRAIARIRRQVVRMGIPGRLPPASEDAGEDRRARGAAGGEASARLFLSFVQENGDFYEQRLSTPFTGATSYES